MSKHTNEELAENFNLWQEYVDPSGLTSREEFEAQSVEEKIAFIVSCFGNETAEA
jgi:hypothetical protein